tara:strand:+ start:566 stop:1339 length:774 start_codon:yes stop_codon:yes gene_type:complete
LSKKSENLGDDVWEKETILSTPTKTKLTFSNPSSLQYDINVSKNSYLFWDSYIFQSNIKNLEIDLKYPEIVNFLNINEDDLSWLVPAKRYIFYESIKLYRDKNMIDQMTVDRINNQIDTYISYVKEKDYEKEFSRKSSEIFIEALSPMSRRLSNNFFTEMTLIIDDLEKEFEKNTNLMLDSFTFSVVIPGNLRNTNATLISALDKTVYWEFNFNDIATNHFNMYAHSIVINNLALQLFLLIILLVFAGFVWKKRLKK